MPSRSETVAGRAHGRAPRGSSRPTRGKSRSAGDFLPDEMTLEAARGAAAGCRGCRLWEHATRTVFGEGPENASLMLVGEMAGDREDLAGQPFVGPAGQLLDDALEAAGIDRSTVYITNAVKHFKWEPRGKRRLHRRPTVGEITACLPWVEREIGLVSPAVVVCLGATAIRALVGPRATVSGLRGQLIESVLGPQLTATIHPSALLRMRGREARLAEMVRLVADLEFAREAAANAAAPRPAAESG